MPREVHCAELAQHLIYSSSDHLPIVEGEVNLPSPARAMLDERLRAASYGAAAQLAEWLQSLGFQASRSAVGRYALVLRASDARNGNEAASLLQTRADKRRGGSADLRALTEALGAQLLRLEKKQSAIAGEVGRLRVELQQLSSGSRNQGPRVAWRGSR